MNTLSNTVGTRINFFDNVENPTVELFNTIFPECPIRNKCPLAMVTIGIPESNNCRTITVGDETIKHKMYSDILYTLDKEEYYLDERDLELESINGVTL